MKKQYSLDLTSQENKLLRVNSDSTGIDFVNASKVTSTYRISTTGGNYTSIEEAFTAINAMSSTDGVGIRLVLDAGDWTISDTVTIESMRPVYFEGSGVNTTFIKPTTGLTNKPMFSVSSSCNFNKMTFESTGLTDYGTLSTENCINLNTTESIEIDNFKISGFYNGINVINCHSVFLFNFMIENSTNFAVNIDTDTEMSNVDIEVGTIQNCNGINLLSGTGSVFDISSTIFLPGTGHTGIVYIPATYTYADHPSIHTCKWDNTGTFFTGFDFIRTDGRDKNIVISSNIGSEDKTPHAYLNIINNTTATTVVNNTWTKLNFGGTISKYENKILFDGNRFTYLPTNRRDLMVWGSGTLTTSTQPSSIELVIVKNGNTTLLTSPISVTLDSNSRKFQWSANAYMDGANANDYWEIWGRGVGANETIILEDFNLLIKSM